MDILAAHHHDSHQSTTLPETNIAPENRPSQKETSIPTIHFQVRTVSFRECNQLRTFKIMFGQQKNSEGQWDSPKVNGIHQVLETAPTFVVFVDCPEWKRGANVSVYPSVKVKNLFMSLRVQTCPIRNGFKKQSYSGHGIETTNPTLGRGLDS